MKIAIDQIKVDEEARIRKDVGDLKPLEDSISEVGLINPILIDEQHTLVAGYRRLSACKNLGMDEVEATIATFDKDMMKLFEAEIAENLYRKDFTPEEILAAERRRQEIIEALREKGLFERLLLWLKNLFAPNPGTQKEKLPPQQTTQQPPTSEATTEPEKVKPVQPKKKAKEQEQPKTTNDIYNIKWRS